MVEELYAEIRPKLFAGSWHCAEIAALALACDRGRGGHGCVASGMLKLPSGDVTPHLVFITDSGMTIDGYMGQVRLSERASIGLTVDGMSGVR